MRKRWLSIMMLVCILTTSISFPSAAINSNRSLYQSVDASTSSNANHRQEELNNKLKENNEIQNEQNLIASGSCGDDVTWNLSTDGVLTISGKGKMKEIPNDNVGWAKYRPLILELKIEDGIESIGNSFSYYDNLTNVIIGDNINTIGNSTFEGCRNLKEINLGKGVNNIGSRTFFGCENLTKIKINENIKTIGESAFDYCNNLSYIYYSGNEKQWNAISVDDKNTTLSKAIICFENVESECLEFNDHLYGVMDESLSWEDAKDACEKLGGHLVTITSQEEQDFIQELLNNRGRKKQYWIGAKYIDDSFVWITGEDFVYENWDDQEPNLSIRDKEFEECVQILNEPNPSYRRPNSQRFKWNDMFYDNIFPGEENFFNKNSVGYICEWERNQDNNEDSKEEFTYLDLPTMSEESARAFLGFIYNKSNMKKVDLSENKLFLLMTGKITEPEEQYKIGITFMTILNNQMENHLKKSSQASEYLSKDLQKYFEKKVGKMSNLSEEIYNNELNKHMGILEDFVTDVLCTSAYSLTNIAITESMLNDLKLAFSTYSKVIGLEKKINNFVEGTKAFVQMGFLVLESEFAGRYKYFDLYLELRKDFEPSDDIFRISMDANKVILSDKNPWSGLLVWLPWISTWQEQVSIIEAWAEYTYQLQTCLNQVKESNKFKNGNYQNISIQCPVSVFIINAEGTEIGSIRNGRIINKDVENLYLCQYGDSKVICVTNDTDYKIEILAQDDGMLSYSNKIIENHKEIVRYNYYMLPLKMGEKYVASNLQDGLYKELKRIETSGTEEDLELMEIIENQEKEVLLEIAVEGDGEVVGNTKYIKGDYVYLSTFPHNSASFLGWYQNGICVSVNPEFNFTILSDMKYVAKFSGNEETNNSEDNNQETNAPEDKDEEISDEETNIPEDSNGETGDKETNIPEDNNGETGDKETDIPEDNNEETGDKEIDVPEDSIDKTDDDKTNILDGEINHFGSSSGGSRKKSGMTSQNSRQSGSWMRDDIGWWYCFADGSYPKSSWNLLEYNQVTNWYHFNVAGYMDYGWFTDTDGKTYYLNSISNGFQGAMLSGWQLLDGYWYYFNPLSGVLLSSTITPDGYMVDDKGRWIN